MTPYYETKRGKLYHGDCLEVMRELEDNSVDAVVTDPPYNIKYHYNTYKDNLEECDYYDWLTNIFIMRPHVIIHYPESIFKYSFHAGIFPDKIVSWVYNANTPRQHRTVAFFGIVPDFSKGSQPYLNPSDKRIKKRIEDGKTARLYDWWHINQVKNVSKEKTKHPAQIPLRVMKNILDIIQSDLILDPFFGSGTTGVACELMNRRWIGIELDEEYCEIAAKRIEEASKQHALFEGLE